MSEQKKKYLEALDTMWRKQHASISKTDGRIIEGIIFNTTSSTDSENGVGYITIKDKAGRLVRVYENEFSELIKAW